MSERGRRRERPAQGYLSPTEAAQILNVVPATIKNMIKRGELEGGQYLTKANERRWEVSEESVKALAEARGQPANIAQIERAFKPQLAEAVLQVIQSLASTVTEQGTAQVEEIQTNRKTFLEAANQLVKIIKSQDAEVKMLKAEVEAMRKLVATNGELAAANGQKFDRALELMNKMAEVEKAYQERVIEILEQNGQREDRVLELLSHAERVQTQREEHGGIERRSLFRRLFGT
jgi:hypothetical protein